MTDTKREDELDKMLWPHPFDDGSKPLQVAVTGDTEKVFVIPYSAFKTLISKYIATKEAGARIDELENLLNTPNYPMATERIEDRLSELRGKDND